LPVIELLIALNTQVGVGTTYAGEYVGRPLFCATPDNPLYYDATLPPWVALPVSEYGHSWQCGDLSKVTIYHADGTTEAFTAHALDAGPFGRHCVVTGDGCLPIVVDVPAHLVSFTSSARVEVVNLSAVARDCRERGICD